MKALHGSIPLLLALAGCETAIDQENLFDAPEIPIHLELRVGSLDGPDALGSFGQLVVAGDGRIYIGQASPTRVLVFSPDGRRLGALGREGSGPGEFRRIAATGIRGDTLWVLDREQLRFTYFDLDGALLGTHALPVRSVGAPDQLPPMPVGLLADGTILGMPAVPSMYVATGAVTGTALLRLDGAGEVLDTIGTYSLLRSQWTIGDPSNRRGPQLYTRQPYTDSELVQASPFAREVVRADRTAAQDASRGVLTISRLDFSGDTLWTRSYVYRPEPLARAEVEELLDSRSEGVVRMFANPMFGQPGTPAQIRGWAAGDLYAPAFRPPVSDVLIGRDGTLWLERTLAGGEVREWIVLDANGDPLGIVRPSGRIEILAADRERVWGAEYDEMDVPYLVRYRLREDR